MSDNAVFDRVLTKFPYALSPRIMGGESYNVSQTTSVSYFRFRFLPQTQKSVIINGPPICLARNHTYLCHAVDDSVN